MDSYLKPKQHYIDLYDRSTVEICRRWLLTEIDSKEIEKRAEVEKLDKEEAKRVTVAMSKVALYFQTGERYLKKEETIREWMERDEKRDKFIETATAPEDITCLTCGRLMFVSSKYFNMGFGEEKDTILFMYDCPLEHIPHRAFYNTGEEFRREKPHCPKCQTPVKEEDKTTEEKFITLISCPNCDYRDITEIERIANKESKPDPNYERDREEFCLSEKKGQEFIEAKRNIESIAQFMDKIKEKEQNKEVYDKVANLKKLKIIELEELLVPVLEKAGYIKLQFKNPEIKKDVIVPFIVYEHKPDREGRASTYDLERLLRKTLKETNWRLMSDGTSYRLGMLEGRLRGYEGEEDLVILVQKDKAPK